VLSIAALLSATHDIALDGFYLLALRREQQAFFAGIRSTFFRLGWVFASGALVVLAGLWERAGTSVVHSWRNALLIAAGVYALLLVYGSWVTPHAPDDGPARAKPERASFADAFRSFIDRPKIWTVVGFILLYRFGEAMLTKLSFPFLMDARSRGGLGLDTVQVGNIAISGTVSLLGGGVLGGYLISRYGLRRLRWLMAVAMNLPNVPYVWLAYTQAGLPSAYVITIVEQFGYGFGLASLLVYMMYTCRGSRYSTSHYAIATAILAFGAMVAGIASGPLQKAFGYAGFFAVVCAATVPGMLLLRRIPLEEDVSQG
jgi:PAT family beta-lactamase induction signal transducer AmpG